MSGRNFVDPNVFAQDVLKQIIAKHDPEGVGEIVRSEQSLRQTSRVVRSRKKGTSPRKRKATSKNHAKK